MSELYFVHIESVGPPLDLDQAVARAASLDLNARAATKILKKATGPYVEDAGPLRLYPTPDPESFTFVAGGMSYLVHAPTKAITRCFDGDVGAVWWADRKKAVWLRHGVYAFWDAYDFTAE